MNIYWKLYQLLDIAYGNQQWWPAQSPFEMMIGAVLTQNTAWRNVERSIAALSDKMQPAALAGMEQEELEQRIRPSGCFRVKAQRIRSLLEWYARYGYSIERLSSIDTNSLRAELLAVRGIGRETADCILLYALGRPVFVIDSYARRVTRRVYGEDEQDYDRLAAKFRSGLPQDVYVYNQYHALLVQHCKVHCTTKPKCVGCPLAQLCESVNIQ